MMAVFQIDALWTQVLHAANVDGNIPPKKTDYSNVVKPIQ